MKNVSDYINANNNSYIEELKNFLRIKSISTDENHKKDMLKGAEFVSKKLKDAGMNKVRIIKTNGHPLVYAEWLNALYILCGWTNKGTMEPPIWKII